MDDLKIDELVEKVTDTLHDVLTGLEGEDRFAFLDALSKAVEYELGSELGL